LILTDRIGKNAIARRLRRNVFSDRQGVLSKGWGISRSTSRSRSSSW